MKKLSITITDIEALEAAYPEVIETTVVKTVNRSKLRPLVNALYGLGIRVAGVNAFYSAPAEPEIPEKALEQPHD